MSRQRLIPPNPAAMPAAITGPMPRGDAQDPPVDQIALEAARDIYANRASIAGLGRAEAVSRIQIRVEEAIGAALDRCQALGGRRVR